MSSARQRSPRRAVHALFLLLLLAGSANLARGQASPVAAEDVSISLRGGQIKKVTIDLGADSRPNLAFKARVEPSQADWPDELGLAVEREIPFKPDGRKLVLRISARHCCRAGEYEARVVISAGEREAIIPLKLLVERDPVCRAAMFGAGLWIFLSIGIGAYLRSMYFNSTFISPERLSNHLVPQRWGSLEQMEGVQGKKEEIHRRILAQLTLGRRFLAWLQANPFVFGLPRKRYTETVSLELGRRPDDLSVQVVSHRDPILYYQIHRDEAQGKLFASATPSGGFVFFGLPDKQGLVGRLRPDSFPERLAPLRRNTTLSEPEPPPGDRTYRAAGWQIRI